MKPDSSAAGELFAHRETMLIEGHIIDSLLLPKVLDCITQRGGRFKIQSIRIGQRRNDPSQAVVEVSARTPEELAAILAQISDHGAVPAHAVDARLVPADVVGAFPEDFYSTTNQPTEVRIGGQWRPVALQEMDCGIVVDATGARCVPMTDVALGMPIVCGHAGVRVRPEDRQDASQGFAFMQSAVSTEKPKRVVIRRVAEELLRAKRAGGKSLVVGGPAIIHTGSGPLLVELIERGYVHKLFAGNALATHDIEQAMFGTSLGVHLVDASLAEAGHEHHLRAINRVRRAGSIAAAINQGLIHGGVMHACHRHGVEYLLAGSIRDDGPLPEVISDALEAQRRMRAALADVQFCLMIATMLHSVAVGNLLPARVPVVCVDINPTTITKLADRGSFQTIGIVTDVEPFLRAVVQELNTIE